MTLVYLDMLYLVGSSWPMNRWRDVNCLNFMFSINPLQGLSNQQDAWRMPKGSNDSNACHLTLYSKMHFHKTCQMLQAICQVSCSARQRSSLFCFGSLPNVSTKARYVPPVFLLAPKAWHHTPSLTSFLFVPPLHCDVTHLPPLFPLSCHEVTNRFSFAWAF